MPSRHDPADALRDIMENAARSARHLAGVDHGSFSQDERTRDAVERCIERVCEATIRLGELAEALMPGQPWKDIRGMGNRLRHAYDRIDAEIVWQTAQARLPELAAEAGKALARLRAEKP